MGYKFYYRSFFLFFLMWILILGELNMTKPESSDVHFAQIRSTTSAVIYDLNATSDSTYISAPGINPENQNDHS